MTLYHLFNICHNYVTQLTSALSAKLKGDCATISRYFKRRELVYVCLVSLLAGERNVEYSNLQNRLLDQLLNTEDARDLQVIGMNMSRAMQCLLVFLKISKSPQPILRH